MFLTPLKSRIVGEYTLVQMLLSGCGFIAPGGGGGASRRGSGALCQCRGSGLCCVRRTQMSTGTRGLGLMSTLGYFPNTSNLSMY